MTFIENEIDGIKLEAQVERGDKNSKISVILTHPYSWLGGSMYNNVTDSVFKKLKSKVNTIVAFNFRGVGESTGWSTLTGWNERNDVIAVCKYIKTLENPGTDIYIIGYSAGSAIACGVVDELDEIKGYCAIGYPYGWTTSIMFSSHYPKAITKKSKLFVIGDNDQFTSVSTLKYFYDSLEGDKDFQVLEGADHFFFGDEKRLAQVIEKWISKY